MSSTSSPQLQRLLGWLDSNGFWREDLVVQPLKYGGLGVFGQIEDGDPLLLRIPKSNVLSPKNLSVFNLLYEYEPKHDLSIAEGMYGLIMTVVYETAAGNALPWADYLALIDFKSLSVPVCLWDDADKANLEHSEVDLMGVLDPTEMSEFFNEACQFAKAVEHSVAIPGVLANSDQLVEFGKVIQLVISRAFFVDSYHQLALVPGADLFNHLSPIEEDGVRVDRENVHFMCDDDVCEICGEQACGHQGDEDEDMDEDSEGEEDSEMEGNDAENDQENAPITEITHEAIAALEAELDLEQDTEPEDDEALTIDVTNENAHEFELARELCDDSKCCDIALVQLPEAENDYEIFNSYGADLSNAYLLQRYGFLCKGNINDSVSLLVQLMKYVKKQSADDRMEWLEEVWDLVCDMLHAMDHDGEGCGDDCDDDACGDGHDHVHDPDQEHGCGDEGCEDEGCHGGEENHDDCFTPQSWQLAARIKYDGSITPHTYVILLLLALPKPAYDELVGADDMDAMVENIQKHLMDANPEDFEELLKNWAQQRLQQYPELKPSPHLAVITELLDGEKAVIRKFLE